VIIIHDRQISRHGGASGIQDWAVLDEACARPINQHGYGEENVFALAAAYAYGIAKAHAFVDGNKRTAFVTAAAFLRLNGYALRPDPIEGVRVMEDLSQDILREGDFAVWLEGQAAPT